MKRIVCLMLVALFTMLGSAAAIGGEDEARQAEEQRIGAMVLDIQAALAAPEDPKSLETIVKHGTDTRYYIMIRGWLIQLKTGTQSQLDSVRDPALKAKHRKMSEFLAKAIRRIDLE